ncbi:hypothetical protein M0812_17820 [Anaeramoeba flamelloides]|uniref:Uncharacterized protein n=1 Tax=Anaeramoeba flamelloides TaxID=1746091 RepID=A0AAV7Z0Z9_9EUKA|nr:hypothetical protein M0812_17820 [Anaeramoeba flamelloides]
MSWQPEENVLLEIYSVLQLGQEGSTEVQQQVYEQIEKFSKEIEYFNRYLAIIFVDSNIDNLFVRQLSGIILKNNLINNGEGDLGYLQEYILFGLKSEEKILRLTCSTLIASVVTRFRLFSWKELINQLKESLVCSNINEVLSSLDCLQKIFQDLSFEFGAGANNIDLPNDYQPLIPIVLELMIDDNDMIRISSLSCIKELLVMMPDSLYNLSKNLIETLLLLIENEINTSALVLLSESISIIEDYHPYLFDLNHQSHQNNNKSNLSKEQQQQEEERLKQQRGWINEPLIPFMVNIISPDSKLELILNGCMFWDSWSKNGRTRQQLRKYIPTMIGSLYHHMKYTDGSLLERYSVVEDESNEEGEYSVRKAASSALESLSKRFGSELLDNLLLLIKDSLKHEKWIERECAILSIGQISYYCYNEMLEYLPELIPYLFECVNSISINISDNIYENEKSKQINNNNNNNNNNINQNFNKNEELKSEHPLLRSTALWAIGRYIHWILKQKDEQAIEQIYQITIECLFAQDPFLQISACSCLSEFIHEGSQFLSLINVNLLIETLGRAVLEYSASNLKYIYSVITNFFESFGQTIINNNELQISRLIEPLINQLEKAIKSEISTKIIKVFNVLSAAAANLEDIFLDYSEITFNYSFQLMENILIEYIKASQSKEEIYSGVLPEKEPAIFAFNFLSCLIQGIKSKSAALIENSDLLNYVEFAISDFNEDLRESSTLLLSQLSIHCFDQIMEYLPNYLTILTQNLHSAFESIFINSCNCIIEISNSMDSNEMEKYLPNILKKLINSMFEKHVNKRIPIMAAITISHLALSNPQFISQHFESFAEPWFYWITRINETSELDNSFRAVCNIATSNPNVFSNYFLEFCQALVYHKNPEKELKNALIKIFLDFKNSLQNEWFQYYQSFPEKLRNQLKSLYNF